MRLLAKESKAVSRRAKRGEPIVCDALVRKGWHRLRKWQLHAFPYFSAVRFVAPKVNCRLLRMDEDAQLIARCRAGERSAWDQLFDRFHPVAIRFVFQLSPDFTLEDAEEICQETFMAVIRSLANFHGDSAFQTWLLRIAVNKASDFRGKMQTAKRGGGIAPISLDAPRRDGRAIDAPSTVASPDANLQNAETAALLRGCLDQLEPRCREIIELRYYGDLSYDEIAASLHLHPKTVSSRLSRCLSRLAELARPLLQRENFDSFAV